MRYLKKFESYQDNTEVGYTLKFKITFRAPDYYDGGDTYFPEEGDLSDALEYSGLDTANEYQAEYIIEKNGEFIFIVTCTNEKTDEYFPDEYDIDNAIEVSFIDKWNTYEIEVLDDPIYNIYKLLDDESDIELLNDYDIIRDNGKSIVLYRLNDFLDEIGKSPVDSIEGYKNI